MPKPVLLVTRRLPAVDRGAGRTGLRRTPDAVRRRDHRPAGARRWRRRDPVLSGRCAGRGGDRRPARLRQSHRHVQRRLRPCRRRRGESARHQGLQHARRAERRHCRMRHAAAAGCRPPRRRRRAPRALGRLAGWAPTQLLGTQVSGRRLGIFGMGRIGRELARMARGFGMEIHYRDMARLPPDLEQGAMFHDNDDSFLPMCETLSLNAPGGGRHAALAGCRHASPSCRRARSW